MNTVSRAAKRWDFASGLQGRRNAVPTKRLAPQHGPGRHSPKWKHDWKCGKGLVKSERKWPEELRESLRLNQAKYV